MLRKVFTNCNHILPKLIEGFYTKDPLFADIRAKARGLAQLKHDAGARSGNAAVSYKSGCNTLGIASMMECKHV